MPRFDRGTNISLFLFSMTTTNITPSNAKSDPHHISPQLYNPVDAPTRTLDRHENKSENRPQTRSQACNRMKFDSNHGIPVKQVSTFGIKDTPMDLLNDENKRSSHPSLSGIINDLTIGVSKIPQQNPSNSDLNSDLQSQNSKGSQLRINNQRVIKENTNVVQMHPGLTLPKFARMKQSPSTVVSNAPPRVQATVITNTITPNISPTNHVNREPTGQFLFIPSREPKVDPPIELVEETSQLRLKNPPLTIPRSKIDKPLIQVDDVKNATPKTPLVIPKIGMSKGKGCTTPSNCKSETTLGPNENPWLPSRNEGSSDVKIAAITPIGTIAMVPTIHKRPPFTPRYQPLTPRNQPLTPRNQPLTPRNQPLTPRNQPLTPGNQPLTPGNQPLTPGKYLTLKMVNEQGTTPITIQTDPILTATIYLDFTKPRDQDYGYVANKMKAIRENTLTLQQQYKNDLKPLINASGRVSVKIFEEALQIYENNQVYYQDRIDDRDLDLPTVRARLTELEQWFLCIIEPKPIDDIPSWIDRERNKLIKGISSYCDPELYPYIVPASAHVLKFITLNHVGLF
ncbi:Hypothetical protein HVR_LOCUS1365 [uncultured virus]|nr:Hypothetical protein HVR_LOCUS1365 [uncultured virus]